MKDLINATAAEQAVLGAILIDGKCLRTVSQKLREDDFSTEVNREIYRIMLSLDADGKFVDGMLVGAAMRRSDPSDDKALRSYLAQIMEITPTSANVMEYAEIVREKAKRRRLRESLTKALEQVDAGEKDDSILPELEAALADNSRRSGSELISPKEQVDSFYEHRRRIDDGEKPYVRTGIKPLDQLLAGGLQEGGLYFMAARPGMGKTALGLHIAEYVATTVGTVIFVSMEMTKAQISARRIAAISKVNSKLILTDNLTDEEYGRVADATIQLGKTPMYITDGAAYSAARIAALARSRKDVKLVVVDHFSLIDVPGRQRNDIEYALAAHSLKRLAKNLNCPVLCLAQLNRENEQRSSKRPRLSDLRETGAAEQDADGVLLLHRPDYYEEEKDAKKGAPSLMEVIVAKNRHGETGKVDLSYYKATNIFREMYVR